MPFKRDFRFLCILPNDSTKAAPSVPQGLIVELETAEDDSVDLLRLCWTINANPTFYAVETASIRSINKKKATWWVATLWRVILKGLHRQGKAAQSPHHRTSNNNTLGSPAGRNTAHNPNQKQPFRNGDGSQGAVSSPLRTKKNPTSPNPSNRSPPRATRPVSNKKAPTVTRNPAGKLAKSASTKAPHLRGSNGTTKNHAHKDSNWKFSEQQYSGSSSYEKIGKLEKVVGKSIEQGIQQFKANPTKYCAMYYQSNMLGWAANRQQYHLVHRLGTEKWKPVGVSPSGWMTVLLHEHQRLTPFKDNVLPKQYRDKYTDTMTFQGRRLHSASNKPLLPGRGMGVVDAPE